MNDYKQSLGERLKALRTERNLTQSKVCSELKNYGCFIDRTTYTKYETGDRLISVDVLIALAMLFEVKTDYILGLK